MIKLLKDASNSNLDLVSFIQTNLITFSKDKKKKEFFIEDIVLLLKEASSHYYNTETALIEDSVYDEIRDILQKHDPQNSFFQIVGADPGKGKTKISHPEPMGSLDKVTTLDDLLSWYEKYTQKQECVLMDKLDGNSVRIEYKKGTLSCAASRGTGYIGEDITKNILRMDVPKIIPILNEVEIRGEFLILNKTWETEIRDKAPEGERPSNARNSASGISRRDDGIGCEFIKVYAYKLSIKGSHNLGDLKSKSSQLEALRSLGFQIPRYKIANSFDEITSYIKEWGQIRSDLPYIIDGVVIEDNDTIFAEEQGMSNLRPKASRAYKFPSEAKTTTLKDIIWQVGRTGEITPVGIVYPTEVGGVTINRASLCNVGELVRLKIGIGSQIRLERKNDVIPKITKTYTCGQPLSIPNECPECHQPVKIYLNHNVDKKRTEKILEPSAFLELESHISTVSKEKDDWAASLFCDNEECGAKAILRILHFVKTLEVKGMGEKLIEKLFEAKKITTPADLYNLKVDDISSLDGLGDKVATKVLQELKQKSKGITLPKFIKALAIPGFSESFADIVSSNYPTLEKMREAKKEDVENINRIGPQVAEAMIRGLKKRSELIEKLIPHLTIATKTGRLTGTSFCFTGFRDKEIQSQIESLGGKVCDSYSKSITYLVCKDPQDTSKKIQKAKQDGVNIIGIDKLKDLLK